MKKYDTAWEGEAYSYCLAANPRTIRVRLDDRFMRAVQEDGDWELTARTDGKGR